MRCGREHVAGLIYDSTSTVIASGWERHTVVDDSVERSKMRHRRPSSHWRIRLTAHP